MPFSNILVTTDLSQESKSGFRLAASLGATHARILHVVTDWEVPSLLSYEYVPSEEQLAAQRQKHAQLVNERLSELAKEWFPGGNSSWETIIASSNVAQEIADYARKQGCDLIVMASHGRGTIGTLLLGSVVQRVLKLASCPVLVAPRGHTG